MSIVPVGNKRSQVNQGSFKYESLMSSSLFDGLTKEAIGSLAEPRDKEPRDPELDRAMSGGGLDIDRHMRQEEIPDLGIAGQNPSSITPSGNPQTGQQEHGSPADQFMGTNPDDQQQDVANPYINDVQKIKQFFGSSKWGLKITPAKDGSLELVITPVPGVPVNANALLQKLEQVVGGVWGGESTPAQEVGGPITFKYTPAGMGAGGATKVTKDGPPLGAPDQSGVSGSPGEIQEAVPTV